MCAFKSKIEKKDKAMVLGLTTPGSSSITSGLSGAASDNSDTGLGDFDTFLTLLVTQLQNQDPLNPLESSEFTGQLATFSQLEQQVEANDLLRELTTQSDFSAQLLAVSYIDQQVLAPSGLDLEPADVTIGDRESTLEFAYDLSSAAADATVELRDGDGQLVKTFEGGVNQGLNFLDVDLIDADGNPIAPGEYRLTVTANGADGERVNSRLFDYSTVNSITGDSAGATLSLADGREVTLDDVLRVRSGSINANSGTETASI